MIDDHDRLPPELAAALAAIPTEAPPPPGEEDRTVRALRRRGLLPPSRWQRVGWYAGAAAAAALCFVGGARYGQTRGARAPSSASSPRASDAMTAAHLVQRTGSEYVTALVRFAVLSRSAPADPRAAEGREAAATTLCAAAAQLPRMASSAHVTPAACDTTRAALERSSAHLYWF